MYDSDILCEISKVPFEIPHKIYYPYFDNVYFMSTLYGLCNYPLGLKLIHVNKEGHGKRLLRWKWLSNKTTDACYSFRESRYWVMPIKNRTIIERLRSEIPPTMTWLPILVIHIRFQVKVTNFKNCHIFNSFARNFTRDKPSEVRWIGFFNGTRPSRHISRPTK